MKILILTMIVFGFLWGSDQTVTEKEQAPDFSLTDENGALHTLSQYKGSKVVVYFYPKDDTPGCTKEACGIRDNYKDFTDNQIVVLGISYDNAVSHKKFKKKYNIPFHLLTDEDKSVSKSYGAEGMFFPSRKTFLIDENGIVVKVYEKVNVLDHAEDILQSFSIRQ